jgi:ELWxxDGT repeat protein
MSRIRGFVPIVLALVCLAAPAREADAQYKLQDLRAGLAGSTFPGSAPDDFIEFNGNVYFFARFADGIGGSGLFRTDGTRDNTVLVQLFDAITEMAVVNGRLLLSATPPTTVPPLDGLELWGTTDGVTVTMVKDLRTGDIGTNPSRFFVWNDRLLFAADPNGQGPVLFVSDGTEAGTTSLDAYKDPQEFAPFGTDIFFTAKSLQTDAETRLWSWGGDPLVSAALVEDRVVGNLAVLGTSLYVTKRSGIAPRREGELWRTDGVPFTAVKVSNLWPGGHAAVADKTVMGGVLYFTACDPALGRGLYRTDGTVVTLVKDFLTPNPTPGAPPLAPANSCDVDYPATGADRDAPNGPSQLSVINGKLYFELDDGLSGRELWTSDGTTLGTVLLADINPGIEPSDLLIDAAACGRAACRAVTAGGFYFTAVQAGDGRGLFFCDGSTVSLVAQVDSTERSGVAMGRMLLATGIPGGDKVFFSGSDDDGNAEPWVLPVTPTLSTSDVRVREDSGVASVLVRLSPPNPSATVTAAWTTVDGSATAGSDFTASSDVVSFAPGETEKLIDVPLLNDAAVEPDETFVVRLSAPVNAELAVTDATVTLGDDSPDGPFFEVLPPAASPNEGSPMTFQVRLTGAHAAPVTVYFRTIAITAASPSDFTHRGQPGQVVAQLSFAATAVPGAVVNQNVGVTTINDTTFEDDEVIGLEIYGANGASILTRVATGILVDWDPNTINFRDPLPSLSIGNRTVTEGNVFADHTVTLSNPTERTVRVYWSTPDSVTPPALPTTRDVDFRNASGFITFRPGQTTNTVTLDTYEDGIDEGNELAYVELDTTATANASVFSGRGVLTITDDELGVLSVTGGSVTEGDAGTVDVTFTVALSVPFYQDFTVNYATADGSATSASGDYVAKIGVLTFPGGTTQQTVSVSVNGDLLDEANETFTLTVSGSSGPDTSAVRSATGTILNDDTSISVNNASVTEGNTGTANLTFTATLTKAYREAVTVTYTTSEGGGASLATSGTDFVATTGQVTIAQGATSATFTVPVIGDVIDENAETFLVTLSNSSGPIILDAEGIGTINDLDTAQISLANVTVTEGSAGTTNAVFTLRLSVPYHRDFTVDWTTAAGVTNPATEGADYTASGGTVTFPALSTTGPTLSVPVIGDVVDEVNETFRVTFSNSSGPGPTTGAGTATITDDDAQVISVQDVSVLEGNSGTTPAVFTVTLSHSHEQTIAVTVATTGGGPTPPAATAGADFTTLAATSLSFAPGVDSRTVSVNVIGDTVVEANNESFGLALSNPTAPATLARTKALGIILDDDSSRTVSLSPLSITVQEPASGTASAVFTVVLNVAAGNTVTVNYATANLTATAGADYLATAGTLSFDPGEQSKTVSVTILADAPVESPERFTLTLSAPTNATLVTGATVATATITDPAGAPAGAFYTVVPCRVFDSRSPTLGGPAPLPAGGEVAVAFFNRCGIPATAVTVSVNVTVTQPTAPGYLTVYPSGVARPLVSVINFATGQTRANSAIVGLGSTGLLRAFSGQAAGSSVHVIIDVNGYFE